MTIEREDLGEENLDDNQEKEANPSDDAKKAEAARLALLEEKVREQEIKAAKAEAALEESRRISSLPKNETPSVPQISEEQWKMAEERTGKTREQIIADANLHQNMIANALKPVMDEIGKAKEEARIAKEEAAKLKSRKSLDDVMVDFLKKNPALDGHRGAIQDFLNTYPDNDNVSPDVFKKRLEMSKEIIRGRVRENMNSRRTSESGSERISGGERGSVEFEGEEEESSRFDPRGIQNEGGRILMEKVYRNPGGFLERGEDTMKDYKKFKDSDDRGVEIDESDEWERGLAIRRNKDRIGGTRGAR